MERIAVGNTVHSTPHAEIMGKAEVKEHLPMQEMSLMARIRIFFVHSLEKIYNSIINPLLFFVNRIKIVS